MVDNNWKEYKELAQDVAEKLQTYMNDKEEWEVAKKFVSNLAANSFFLFFSFLLFSFLFFSYLFIYFFLFPRLNNFFLYHRSQQRLLSANDIVWLMFYS